VAERTRRPGAAEVVSVAGESGLAARLRGAAIDAIAYVGLAALLVAWHVVVAEVAATRQQGRVYDLWRGVGVAIPGVACLILGVVLRGRAGLAGRLCGPLLLVGGAQIYFALGWLLSGALAKPWRIPELMDPARRMLFAGVAWLAVATAARWWVAALSTQTGLLLAMTTVAALVTEWLGWTAFRSVGDCYDCSGRDAAAAGNLVSSTLFILAAAGLIILLGEREAASGTPGSERSTALTRVWGGLLPVLWLAGGSTPGAIGTSDEARLIAAAFLGSVSITLGALFRWTRARAYLFSSAAAALAFLLALLLPR
jgi:hypothetical protein